MRPCYAPRSLLIKRSLNISLPLIVPQYTGIRIKLRYSNRVMRIHLASGMHMNVCRNGEQSPPVTHERCCQPEAKTWGKALRHVQVESIIAFIFSELSEIQTFGR